MPYRGGRNYGGGYEDRFATADPLMEAIQGLIGGGLSMFDTVRSYKNENADRAAREAEREAALARQAQMDARDEERWQYGVSRDAQARQDALDAETRRREEKVGDRLTARGISAVPMPNAAGGFSTTYAKVAPSETEEAATLEHALQSRFKLDELRGQAKALGVQGVEGMSLGELQQVVGDTADAKKRAADLQDFKAKESYQEGLLRGRPTKGGAPNGRPLPASIAEKLGSYNATLAVAEDALGKFDQASGYDPATGKTTKAVTGLLDGLRSSTVASNIPGIGLGNAANSAVAALANVASSIMKDRSGGAITPQEFERLSPFLPSKYDDEGRARQKLVDLIGMLKATQQERTTALTDAGYNVGGDDADAWAANYLAKRKKP